MRSPAVPPPATRRRFPAAPDRWLVMRMSPSTDGQQRRAVTGWVLRSGDQNPMPIDLDSFRTARLSQDAIANPLTVLGQGDVAWAAYYDNVVNRLAFYDNLNGIRTGPLAYLVCGWYSNPAQDPLGDTDVKSLTDFNNKMAQLQWQLAQGELNEAVNHSRNYILGASKLGLTMVQARASMVSDVVASNVNSTSYVTSDAAPAFLPVDPGGEALGPYTTDGSWWPNATLFHGSVVAIGWPQVRLARAMRMGCSRANRVALQQRRELTSLSAIPFRKLWQRWLRRRTSHRTKRESSKHSC